MRENRMSGSERGGTETNRSFLPLFLRICDSTGTESLSPNNIVYHFAVDVGEAEVAAGVAVGEFGVIHP